VLVDNIVNLRKITFRKRNRSSDSLDRLGKKRPYAAWGGQDANVIRG
jgi:hypothetical protein